MRGADFARLLIRATKCRAPEVALGRPELPWLAGAIRAGGVLGPFS